MADSEEVLVKIQGDASGIESASKKAKSSVKSVGDEADRTKSKGSRTGSGFKAGFAVAGVAAAAGVAALVDFSKQSIQAYTSVQANITKFQTVASNAGWSSSLQTQATSAFGVISAGAARTAATTAASMGLSGKSFTTLKGSLGDLAVKMGGTSGAASQMGKVTQLASKAIASGSASALSRYGVVLDANTTKQFKAGNQATRTKILNDALQKSVGGLNEKLAQTPAGQMQQLSNSVAAVKTNFGGLLTGAVSPQKFVDSLNTLIDQGVNIFKTMAPKLASSVSTAATAVAQAAPKIVTGLIQGILPALPGLISAVSTAIPEIVQAIAKAIPLVINAIVKALPQIIQGIISLVLAIVKAIPTIIQALIAALPTIITLIITALISNLPQIVSGLVQLMVAIVAALPQIVMTLIKAIPQIFTSIVGAISAQAPQTIHAFSSMFSNASSAVKAVFAPIGAWFGGVWNGIKGLWSGAGSWFRSLFSSAASGVRGAFGGVSSWFSGVWSGIRGVWSGAGSWFRSIGSSMYSGVVSGVGRLGSWFSGLWSGIASGVSSAFNGIVGTLSNVGSRIWSAIKGGLKSTLSSVPVVGGAIVSALHLAKGGPVLGVGTGTSDSNLAALSAGEYVVNAKSAKRIGYQNLNIINSSGRLPTSESGSVRSTTINVTTQGTDALAFAQQMAFMLRRR